MSKEEIEKILALGSNVEFDFSAKCDLCGFQIPDAVHIFPEMKAYCPNCKNNVYTDAFELH